MFMFARSFLTFETLETLFKGRKSARFKTVPVTGRKQRAQRSFIAPLWQDCCV